MWPGELGRVCWATLHAPAGQTPTPTSVAAVGSLLPESLASVRLPPLPPTWSHQRLLLRRSRLPWQSPEPDSETTASIGCSTVQRQMSSSRERHHVISHEDS